MKRDFTAAARNDLLAMVGQVESEKWCDVTDWFGDRFLDLRSLVGELSVDNYLNRMGEYHKLVIDKNNSAEKDINAIFDRVYQVDGAFVARFGACQTRIHQFCALLDRLANVIDPAKGVGAFNPDSLADAFKKYDDCEKVLAKISVSDDGASYDDLNEMDVAARQALMQQLVRSTIDYMPGLKVGEEFELPIGANTSVYYSVEGKLSADSSVGIEAAIDEGRAELKEFSVEKSFADGAVTLDTTLSSDGTHSVALSGKNASLEFDYEGVEYGTSWEFDNKVYTYADGFTFSGAKFYAEESVEVKVDGGSVTTSFGMKSGSGNGWEPVYVPVPEPVYEPVTLPQWEAPDVDWTKVGIVLAATAIVVGGIALTGFTFGGSDAAAAAAAGALVVAL